MEAQKQSQKPRSYGRTFQYMGRDPSTHQSVFYESVTDRIYRQNSQGTFIPVKATGIAKKLEISK